VAVLESEQGLDLADNLATGALGLKNLVEEAKESAAQSVDPLPAVRSLLALGQKPRGKEGAQKQIEVVKALLAQMLDLSAQGGQPGAQGWEKRSVHIGTVLLLCHLTSSLI